MENYLFIKGKIRQYKVNNKRIDVEIPIIKSAKNIFILKLYHTLDKIQVICYTLLHRNRKGISK